MNIKELEQQKNEAYKEYTLALSAWKNKAREEFLQNVVLKCEQENRQDIIVAIRAFGAIYAYPQTDIFIYDGYRCICSSVVFRNKVGQEKALIAYSDPDFDIDTIEIKALDRSVSLPPFDEDGYEEFPFLQCILASQDLYEICERKK